MNERFTPTLEEQERRRDREAIREINATLKELLVLQQRQAAGGQVKATVPAKRLAKALTAVGVLVEVRESFVHMSGSAGATLRIAGCLDAVEEVIQATQALRP